ncbi:MAG: hypothetical protein ACOYEQ_02820 [Bacillota bacterium]|jgi:hypothetical protein
MYYIKVKEAERIESVTFSELGMQESDIEEILRCNIDMICEDEESMLIVGQQVQNEEKGRSDLTAVDNAGSIVLIEIKRDRRDIENRRESFEFQAIRYAASYATIGSPETLVQKVYAPYIERHRDEFEPGQLTSYELGIRKLNEFLISNEADRSFNKKQRIILVASEFDKQTLSAVAWLNSNHVDISCYELTPYRLDEKVYLRTERILPVTSCQEYYVDLMDRPSAASISKTQAVRRSLPRIKDMLEWGVVKEGDVIAARGREGEARLLANGNVLSDGKEKSLQAWLKGIYDWSSVNTYDFALHKESGKTLQLIRQEYMEQEESTGE